MYAVPAAHGPISAATCGMTPLITTSSRNRWPLPANSDADRLLDPGAGRVEQPHERDPLGQRELAQPGDLQLAGHPHRAGHHREVVGGDSDEPAVDLAVTGDDAVGGRVLALHRALGEVRTAVDPELDERPLVDQQRQPLAGGQLLLCVLTGDLLLTTAEPDLLAAGGEILGERAQQAGGGSVGGHGRSRVRGEAESGTYYFSLCARDRRRRQGPPPCPIGQRPASPGPRTRCRCPGVRCTACAAHGRFDARCRSSSCCRCCHSEGSWRRRARSRQATRRG